MDIELESKISGQNERYTIKVNQKVVDAIIKENKKKYFDEYNGTLRVVNFFNKNKKVDNVYRYLLKIRLEEKEKLKLYYFVNKHLHFSQSIYNDHPISEEKNIPVILLILESPHEEEYIYKNILCPNAPAQGKTGINIEECIIEVFDKIINNNKINDGDYRIIIYNPIPYQTSLHYLHNKGINSSFKTLRNNVWKKLWNEEVSIKNEFKDFLKNNDIKIVLNATTSDLKEYVSDFIKSNSNIKNKFEIYHPAAWWNKYNINKIE